MIRRWFRREPDVAPGAPGANALQPVSTELSEIVGALLAQAAHLELMIERGHAGECPSDRDTIVAALEQTRARVEEAQVVLREGMQPHRAS